jgi:hypothetical protein
MGHGDRRGYSWPPFPVGNTAAETHGVYSDRRVAPVADRLAAELAASAPWTSRPGYQAQVAAWARTEARVVLVSDWLDVVGDLDEYGKPRPATALLDRLEARAAKLRDQLGLTPMGHARLLLTVASVVRTQPIGTPGPLDGVLAELMAEGRRTLENRAQRLQLVGSGDDRRAAGSEACAAADGPETAG